jgi:hypothetical protein
MASSVLTMLLDFMGLSSCLVIRSSYCEPIVERLFPENIVLIIINTRKLGKDHLEEVCNDTSNDEFGDICLSFAIYTMF